VHEVVWKKNDPGRTFYTPLAPVRFFSINKRKTHKDTNYD